MAAWIMSIVGVVIFGVILDTIIPDGELQKFIKGIFALITVFVIIAPIPKLVNADFTYDFTSNEIVTDENYLNSFYKTQIKNLEKNTEKYISSLGYNDTEVTIYTDSYSNDMRITGVSINMKKAVINKNAEHIFSYEEIVDKVSVSLNISKGIITRL